jgi:phenylalanyl-tRNA synthetase alpha subunit
MEGSEKTRDLVIRARGGDPAGRLAAFGELVSRFQDMAYGYAYSVLGDFHLAQDAAHQKVFHQLEVLCVEAGADREHLKATLSRVVRAVLGAGELRWTDHVFHCVQSGLEVSVKHGGEWAEIAGCGMLKPETLRQAGFDPQAVSGFAFGVGLERLAMLKHGIADIRELWAPPYVPA